MKLLEGYHLTDTHRKGILATIKAGYTNGEQAYKIGRTTYYVIAREDGTFKVLISWMETRTIGRKAELVRNAYLIKL